MTALAVKATRNQPPPELLITDRILQRWAVSIGDGLPTDRWDDTPGAQLSALDDDTAVIVDQMILRAPENKREFIKKWYKTSAPRAIIARDLKIPRSDLNLEWFSVLEYCRERLEALGVKV